MMRPACTAFALLLCLAWPARSAHAETHDTCAGFIDSLPATITTQGTWCLRHDLATAIASGNAITVTTNNVTIDCNDFKIGGLAAGDTSQARGIHVVGRQNITVRRCGIRGFYVGMWINGGAGHLVEDNRLDNNLFAGIFVDPADNAVVRRNRVFDTGGYPGAGNAYGIAASASVIDNIVSGVFASAESSYPYGISVAGAGEEVRGNLVRGLLATGAGTARGIVTNGVAITLSDNRVSASVPTPGSGIQGSGDHTSCAGNTVVNFAINYSGCEYSSGNLPSP